MADERSFPSQWLRAVLPLTVMHILRNGTAYGYDISTQIKTAGLGDIKGGTLYPLLGRLERNGLISAQWQPGKSGPGRKYYKLTDSGRKHLETQTQQWTVFTRTTSQLFAQPKDTSNA